MLSRHVQMRLRPLVGVDMSRPAQTPEVQTRPVAAQAPLSDNRIGLCSADMSRCCSSPCRVYTSKSSAGSWCPGEAQPLWYRHVQEQHRPLQCMPSKSSTISCSLDTSCEAHCPAVLTHKPGSAQAPVVQIVQERYSLLSRVQTCPGAAQTPVVQTNPGRAQASLVYIPVHPKMFLKFCNL